MSADEESTPTAKDMTDTAVTETHTNKRKASVAGDGEQEADASPKRVRLESPAASNTNGTEDGPIPAPQREPEQQADATHIKPAIAQDSQEPSRNPAQRDPSPPPPRRSSPEPSRSPVASRRPSVPTTEARQAPGSGPDRGRRSISEQEKKRGQRLFGGLLSTLSQKPGGGGGGAGGQQQQKRRAEIERRQQERAQQQRAEDDKRRVQKLAKLNRLREIEQVKLEEDVMRTRHQSMLAQARSLSTKAEPKLFYLPWKLTKDQVELRREQILETTEAIVKEADQFQRQRRERLKKLGVPVDEAAHPSEDLDSRDAAPPPAANPSDSQPAEDNPSPKEPGHENHHDDAGYVMVENEEDTVIY